jgi:hypothetical protein
MTRHHITNLIPPALSPPAGAHVFVLEPLSLPLDRHVIDDGVDVGDLVKDLLAQDGPIIARREQEAACAAKAGGAARVEP